MHWNKMYLILKRIVPRTVIVKHTVLTLQTQFGTLKDAQTIEASPNTRGGLFGKCFWRLQMRVTQLSKLLFALLAAGLLSFSLAQGTLVVAQGTDAVTLDPHDTTDSPSATVTSHIFDSLFELTPDGDIVPSLATEVSFSDDGTEVVLTLRDDVWFHDGEKFNAEAVKVNLERFLDTDNAFQFRFLIDTVTNVAVTGEYEVTLTLESSFAPLLSHFTHSSIGMISPAVLASGVDVSDNPVGTGPFSFVSWDRGSRIDLVRNDNYWGGAAKLDGVSFVAVPENTTRMAMVETGEAHVAVRVPPQDIARIDALDHVDVENVSSVRTVFIFFNMDHEYFSDVRVRRAINHAVDNELIADFLLGGAVRVSDAAISPGVFGYTGVGTYEYNPELAKELLAEAGFPNGFDVELWSPSGRYLQDIQTAETIQSQLAEVGVNVTVETAEWSTYLATVNRQRSESVVPFGLLAWGTVTGDADYGLYALLHSTQHVPNGSNRGFFSNDKLDALLDEARVNTDADARIALYTEALELIHEETPWLTLHSESQLVAVNTSVKGLVIHPTERVLAYTAYLE